MAALDPVDAVQAGLELLTGLVLAIVGTILWRRTPAAIGVSELRAPDRELGKLMLCVGPKNRLNHAQTCIGGVHGAAWSSMVRRGLVTRDTMNGVGAPVASAAPRGDAQ